MRAAAVERMQKAKRDSSLRLPRRQARNDGFGLSRGAQESAAEKKSEGGQVLVEMGDGFDAAEIILQIKMLVGRVSVLIGQTEADQNAGHFERIVHLSDEGNGTAFANENRLFVEALLERSLRALKNRRVVRSRPRLASTENFEFAVHGFRQKLANVFFDELGDALRILAGDEARRKFRVSF